MEKRDLQCTMYELTDPSMPQRVSLAVLVGIWIVLAGWLLLGNGLTVIGHYFGRQWIPGDSPRRILLFAGFALYYVRILGTEFVFLKRGVAWSEVFTVAPWLLFIFLLLAIFGGTNSEPLGRAGAIGVFLYLVGSFANFASEYSRHRWKQHPENRGHLYTAGFFRVTRHPNYLGDLLLFSGLCLLAGSCITAIIPVLMLAGFVFVNIPALDAHLHDHYGAEFDAYAQHTAKLIPFVY